MQSEPDKAEPAPDYAVYYTAVNDLSDRKSATTALFYSRLLQSVFDELPRDSQTLDVGCGAGFLIKAIKSNGFGRLRGVDACATLIDAARARGLPCEVAPKNYVERESACHADRYSAVFLLDVLEHIPIHRQIRFLSGLRSMLRRDGVLVLSVPNATSTLAARWRYND